MTDIWREGEREKGREGERERERERGRDCFQTYLKYSFSLL
jgi:hypothetical protein